MALLAVLVAPAAAAQAGEPLHVAGIPVDFILFALTLLGVALFHNQTFYVALGYNRVGVVPGYALDRHGERHDTVILYRELSGF